MQCKSVAVCVSLFHALTVVLSQFNLFSFVPCHIVYFLYLIPSNTSPYYTSFLYIYVWLSTVHICAIGVNILLLPAHSMRDLIYYQDIIISRLLKHLRLIELGKGGKKSSRVLWWNSHSNCHCSSRFFNIFPWKNDTMAFFFQPYIHTVGTLSFILLFIYSLWVKPPSSVVGSADLFTWVNFIIFSVGTRDCDDVTAHLSTVVWSIRQNRALHW